MLGLVCRNDGQEVEPAQVEQSIAALMDSTIDEVRANTWIDPGAEATVHFTNGNLRRRFITALEKSPLEQRSSYKFYSKVHPLTR